MPVDSDDATPAAADRLARLRAGAVRAGERARELDIEGRSTMTKDELIAALRDH